ncbi:uncharacterized protein [Rutidosis leptorrhynchoides]|uniref:uncharacterized protein n=1 Tax=Rutidosis leptorrhynchoides TaxID=125765 RepID=UPI003A9985C4
MLIGCDELAPRALVKRKACVDASCTAILDTVLDFSKDDLKGIQFPYTNLLVISMMIANTLVRKVLVDDGSSIDVQYHHAFQAAGHIDAHLPQSLRSIYAFNRIEILVRGQIWLPVTLGSGTCKALQMINWLVIEGPTEYNAIFGRKGISTFSVVASFLYQAINFPTLGGISIVRGAQTEARKCCMATFELKEHGELAELLRAEPVEELVQVQVHPTDPEKFTMIGSELKEDIRTEIVKFMRTNAVVFTWIAEDMLNIDPSVIVHRLNINPTAKAVKQKKRAYALGRQTAIAYEVEKLMKAKFIEEIKYPEWLSNPVIVKKNNGKWRICIDFRDLNATCLKDRYSLPRIDILIDATTGHELLSFMDAFSGYNQIIMLLSDVPKVSFITGRGLYCYVVIPFGLKNVKATWQRLVNKIFKPLIGHNMEVYIDGMLVKSV